MSIHEVRLFLELFRSELVLVQPLELSGKKLQTGGAEVIHVALNEAAHWEPGRHGGIDCPVVGLLDLKTLNEIR